MARYYFDTRDNDTFTPDDIGLEITSFERVKAVASVAMARDVLPGSVVRNLANEVRDNSGPVLRVSLMFGIEHVAAQ